MIPKDEVIKKGVTIIDSKQSCNALLETLKANFPETIKDNQVDLKAIATLLELNDRADIQGYELTFTGKGLANALYSTPTQKLLTFETSFMPHCHNAESKKVDSSAKVDSKETSAIAERYPLFCHDSAAAESRNDKKADSKDSTESSPQTPQSFIIRGDNLDALKILKSAYTDKIKMIYIDPPYNTKNENFIYPDNFRKDYQAILQEVGLLEIDENGEEKESETLKFFRNIQGSRTHSGWLAFMLPRLKLARDLLKDDGVIFISIDDNEQANLKILCDEIFGEENFVSNLCVVDNLKGNNNTEGISQTNEYCLIYAKDKSSCRFGDLLVNDDEELEKWNLDEFGYWKEGRNIKGTGENAPREKRPSMFYPIYLNDKMEISLQKSDEFYIEVLPLTNGQEMCWNWGKEFLEKNKHELIVKKTENGFNFIKKQRPALGDLPSKKMKTTCYSPKYSTSVSSNIIKGLFNNKRVFDYSKSPFLIKDLLKISTNTGGGGELSPHSIESSSLDSMDCHDSASAKSRNDDKADSKAQAESTNNSDSKILQEKAQGDKAEAVEMRNCGFQGEGEGSLLDANDRADNAESAIYRSNATPDIVLDFFAGSGTTAQAVMELNAEDGGNRQFILVQLDEPIDEAKSKTAYDFCKNELQSQSPVISDITIERVKRASTKIANENFSGFSVLRLSDRPELITDEEGTLTLLDIPISPRDKALNLALQSGKPLDKPLESIFENKLYKCEDCLYLVACDKEVLEYLRNTQNQYIFIDAFSDISLENFLNLDSSLNERLRVVY